MRPLILLLLGCIVGHWHALFHYFPTKGGHAFSIDGQRWSNITNAYNGTIETDDGDAIECSKRERPSLILDSAGAPAYLVTGCTTAAKFGPFADYSFTAVQPINGGNV